MGQEDQSTLSGIIQIQHGIKGSSKNYWSRGIGCVRLLPDAKRREVASHIPHRGTSNFLLLLEINQVVFDLLYLINILPHKSLLSIIS